jgi:hypothetical protein
MNRLVSFTIRVLKEDPLSPDILDVIVVVIVVVIVIVIFIVTVIQVKTLLHDSATGPGKTLSHIRDELNHSAHGNQIFELILLTHSIENVAV